MKEKGKFALKDWQSLWLVDINYNFECDLLIELSDNKLSDNKLSDNKLASELVENKSFLKPITIEKIVIFMIMKIKNHTEISTYHSSRVQLLLVSPWLPLVQNLRSNQYN